MNRRLTLGIIIVVVLAILAAVVLPTRVLSEVVGSLRLVTGISLIGFFGNYAWHIFRQQDFTPPMRFGFGLVLWGVGEATSALWHAAGRFFSFNTLSLLEPITSLILLIEVTGALLVISAPGEINHLPRVSWRRAIVVVMIGIVLAVSILFAD